MTTRTQIAIGVIIALVVFPFLIVYAQSEGDVEVPALEQTVEQAAPEVTESVVEEVADPAEEAAELTPAAEETAPAEEIPETPESTAESETPEPEGEVLGASDAVAEEPASSEESSSLEESSASTSPASLELDTASSTEPEPEYVPEKERFVLQPAVQLSITGTTVRADIELQNLTCKSCEKVLPELDVLVYYTEWYPNDGPVEEQSEAKSHAGEQSVKVTELSNWSSQQASWSAEGITPGHYYFVVEVDPENTNDAYHLFRSEFRI